MPNVPALPDGLSSPVDRDSDLPLGAQLAQRLRAAVADGGLAPGERAPSIRRLAEAVGVNPNTVRAVYQRLEDEGVLRSEQGRGTFVLGPADPERASRRELQREVARLEAELVRRPPPASEHPASRDARAPGRLLTTEELQGVRDGLLTRLQQLDADRAELLRRLSDTDPEPSPAARGARRSTDSVANVRVRWVGGF